MIRIKLLSKSWRHVMSVELLEKPTLLICDDLDGMMYRTEQFNNDVLASVEYEKGQKLRQDIQEYRELMGTSALMPFYELIGDEISNVNQRINQCDYIYDDVESHVRMTQCGSFAVKHLVLTQGTTSWQKYKVAGTFLENLPIEIRATNDKIDFIGSMLDKQDMYCYQPSMESEGYRANYCFLIEDKLKSFKDGFDSFYTAEQLPNFQGFLLTREGEYSHNAGQEIPQSINQIPSLNFMPYHIENLSLDNKVKIY